VINQIGNLTSSVQSVVSEAVLTAKFDLAANEELRNNWFVFRDRRPDLYGALTTYDGGTHRE